MENMLELMEEPIEVKDIPNALPLMALHGKIDFRNVSFNYTEDRQILKNLNFTVNPGQTFAIVSILLMQNLNNNNYLFRLLANARLNLYHMIIFRWVLLEVEKQL